MLTFIFYIPFSFNPHFTSHPMPTWPSRLQLLLPALRALVAPYRPVGLLALLRPCGFNYALPALQPLSPLLGFYHPLWYKKKHRPEKVSSQGDLSGGCLLSHLRSTIGVTGLNFSVRDGKRWIPGAITTLISFSLSSFRG